MEEASGRALEGRAQRPHRKGRGNGGGGKRKRHGKRDKGKVEECVVVDKREVGVGRWGVGCRHMAGRFFLFFFGDVCKL